jgi:hypothetical protein
MVFNLPLFWRNIGGVPGAGACGLISYEGVFPETQNICATSSHGCIGSNFCTSEVGYTSHYLQQMNVIFACGFNQIFGEIGWTTYVNWAGVLRDCSGLQLPPPSMIYGFVPLAPQNQQNCLQHAIGDWEQNIPYEFGVPGANAPNDPTVDRLTLFRNE